MYWRRSATSRTRLPLFKWAYIKSDLRLSSTDSAICLSLMSIRTTLLGEWSDFRPRITEQLLSLCEGVYQMGPLMSSHRTLRSAAIRQRAGEDQCTNTLFPLCD